MVTMKIMNILNAGDSASWRDAAWIDGRSGLRLTSADWTLTYQLRGPSQLALTAAADGEGWRTAIGSAASAALLPGAYAWAAYLSKAGERVTIGGGSLSILADLAASAGPMDARSLAERALADCEAALASFKSSGGKVKSYTIGSRQTEYHSLTELMALRDFWQRRVNKERAQSAIANGRGNPRRLLVRF
ncbi:hypothetical protein AAKU55_004921 [Oxalobacteraceae bacterium GrIS 1.11]